MRNPFDPIIVLLAAGLVFFTVTLLGVAHWMSSDGQTFQVISGLLTGFAGAFFARIDPRKKPTEPADAPEPK